MLLRTLSLTLVCLALGCSAKYSNRNWTSPNLKIEVHEQDGTIAGRWRSKTEAFGGSPFSSGTWANFEIIETSGGRRLMLGRPIQEIEGLMRALKEGESSVQFRISGDAGIATLTGTRGGDLYEGPFEFRPDPSFERDSREILAASPGVWDLLEFAISNVDFDYLRQVAEGVQPALYANDVLALKRAGVSAEYARSMRAAGVKQTGEIVRLRNSGVPPEMVTSLQQAGYTFSVQDTIRLRNSGATAEYAAGWKNAGFNLAADEIVRLRNSGVPQDYGKAIRESGASWSVDEIVRLRNSGMTADQIRAFRASVPAIPPDELVRLRNAGVSPGYLNEWTAAGYNLKTDELIRLRNSGVPASYAEALNVPGKRPLPVETIIELRNRGISPELARKMRE